MLSQLHNFPIARLNHEASLPDAVQETRHVESRGREGGACGGFRARGGGRGSLSRHASDRSPTPAISNVLPAAFDTNEAPLLLECDDGSRLESLDIPGPSMKDKKGKKALIQGSGSVAGQLLSTVQSLKKEKARGSVLHLAVPESSPTFLLGIEEPLAMTAGDCDKHRRVVESLEAILSEDEVMRILVIQWQTRRTLMRIL